MRTQSRLSTWLEIRFARCVKIVEQNEKIFHIKKSKKILYHLSIFEVRKYKMIKNTQIYFLINDTIDRDKIVIKYFVNNKYLNVHYKIVERKLRSFTLNVTE